MKGTCYETDEFVNGLVLFIDTDWAALAQAWMQQNKGGGFVQEVQKQQQHVGTPPLPPMEESQPPPPPPQGHQDVHIPPANGNYLNGAAIF